LKISNLSKHFVGKILNIFISIVIIPFLIIELDKSEFGLLGIFWLLLPILKRLINLGADVPISIKFFKFKKDDFNNYVIHGLAVIFLNTLLIIFSFLIISIYINIPYGIDSKLVIISILFSLFQTINNIWVTFLKNTGKIYQFEFLQLASKLLSTVMAMMLITFYSKTVFGYMIGLLLAEGLIFIFSFYNILKTFNFLKFNFKPAFIRSIMKVGLPIIPGTLSLYILSYGDRLFVEHFMGLEMVAVYTLAYKLAETAMAIIVTPLINYLEPLLMSNINSLKIKFLIKAFGDLTISILVFICSLLLIFGEEIFILINKVDYIESIPISILLMSGILISGITSFNGIYLNYGEKTKEIFIISLIVGILNLCLNFVLIPKIGLIGAGLSTIASFIFQRILTIKKINETTILSYRLLYSNKFEIISILIMTLCSLLVHDNSLEFINITSRILIYIILFMLSFVFLIRKVILVKKIL